MSYIFLLGDSHLLKCHEHISDILRNFGQSIFKCIWETDCEQIKSIEDKYSKFRLKNGVPKAVVILCGGYDLLLNIEPIGIGARLKKITQLLLSSGVKQIIICSVIDRNKIKNSATNKAIRKTNQILSKHYKDSQNAHFISIRPPGQPIEFLDEDEYHLKNEGYMHVYEKIRGAIIQKVFPALGLTVDLKESINEDKVYARNKETPELLSSVTPMKNDTNIDSTSPSSEKFSTEVSFDKRMAEFKKVLMNDFKRICNEEKDLNSELIEIQNKLKDIAKQKEEISNTYEKLFNSKLNKI